MTKSTTTHWQWGSAMFSKKWVPPILTLALLTSACEKFLKGPAESESEKAKKERVVIDTNDQTKCLKDVPGIFKLFINDQGDASNIADAFSCFQTSLKSFTVLTRGKVKDAYSAQELQHFLNRYLLKGNQISDGLLEEMMKVKVMFAGGSQDIVTRMEIDLVLKQLEEAKEPFGKLSGHMLTLTFRQKDESLSSKSLQEARDALSQLATFALQKTKMTQSNYELRDMKELFNEVSQFIGDPDSLSLLAKWLPVSESVKIVFLGENANFRSKTEWSKGFEWIISAYMTALNYNYFVKSLEYRQPTDWKTLIQFVDQIFDLIETSPSMKNQKILDANAIDRLVDEVWKLELFKTVVDEELAKETYRKALMNMIEANRGSAIAVQGLTESHFRLIRQEYHVWKIAQTQINQIFQDQRGWKLPAFVERLKKVTMQDLAKAMPEKIPLNEELKRSWTDFLRLVSITPTTVHNKNLLVQMYYLQTNLDIHFEGANMMNFIRSLTRLVHRGYGEKRSQHVFDNRMSECGMVAFEEEFRSFGRAIGFLDPRQKSPAKRTFMEGNFFTFHGNGDAFLTGLETYELLNLMMSGGKANADLFMTFLEKDRCLKTDLDVFGKPIADRNCFLESFRKNVRQALPQLPWMVSMISSMNPNQYHQFWHNLSALVIDEHTQSGTIEYANIRSLTTILGYVESLMMVYDANQDQLLSEAEIVAAVPRFATFIQREAETESFTESIFLFLIHKGRKPEGKADILGFQWDRMKGLPPVGKQQLFQVMRVLKGDGTQVEENTCSP